MNCYDSIKRLCGKEGISPTTLCKKLNLSTSMATRWKNGTIPRGSTLEKIADYFGVTSDEVLGFQPSIEELTANHTHVTEKSEDNALHLTSFEHDFILEYRKNPSFAAIVDAAYSAIHPQQAEDVSS